MSIVHERSHAELKDRGALETSGQRERCGKGRAIVDETMALDAAIRIEDSGNGLASSATTIVVIDRRTLLRECLVNALRTVVSARIIAYASVDGWIEDANSGVPAAVLLCVSDAQEDAGILEKAAAAVGGNNVPLIIVGETEDPDRIIDAIQIGARGYIPTNLPLSIAVQALRLVTEGGIFVPANSLIAAHRQPAGRSKAVAPELEMFTARQAAVVQALCRGKANKVIAYELNMCESTVKVHVRNIMKKLKARNRTEVAIMFRSLTNGDPGRSTSRAAL